MSTSDDSTRPISVAELLARNGTIGSPPVGGHRRRRRTGGVTVAELTGEIPVIRTGEIPVMRDDEVEAQVYADGAADGAAELESVTYTESPVTYTESEEYTEYADQQTVTYPESGAYYADGTIAYPSESVPEVTYWEPYSEPLSEPFPQTSPAETGVTETRIAEKYVTETYPEAVLEEAAPLMVGNIVEDGPEPAPGHVLERADEPRAGAAPVSKPVTPPKSRNPLPRRVRGLQRSHDPRPQRRPAAQVRPAEPVRSSGAEQMNYDPVDGAVTLPGLVGDQPDGVEELRTYLQSSSGTLFSGETVADDLARRVAAPGSAVADETPDQPAGSTAVKPGKVSVKAPAKNGTGKSGPAKSGTGKSSTGKNGSRAKVPKPRESRLTAFRHAVVAVLQSMLAVAFGGGLFIAFDQLWRWNNIVALVLSVLVILGLVVGVRVVRKTEDIASTLIAVAVGALVTLGPLALLQSN